MSSSSSRNISVRPSNISANRFNSIQLFSNQSPLDNLTPVITFDKSIKTLIKTAVHLAEYRDQALSDSEIALSQNQGINLMLIGVVSAVESYCRGIIKSILCLDHHIFKQKAYSASLSYGAALSKNTEIYPEAILEECSFTNLNNIKTTIKEILGLTISAQATQSLYTTLQEYEKVCSIRHCIVHRSNKLGSSNAIKLGYDSHSPYIEKQIFIDLTSLEEMTNICSNVVYELNDFLLNYVLRSALEIEDWEGSYKEDHRKFKKYIRIFYDPSICNKKIKELYNEFKSINAI